MKFNISFISWTAKASLEIEGPSLSIALSTAAKNGANLRGANLYGTNLREANLRGTDLRGADLYGANLRGANLREANLRGANLRGTNLRGTDLRGTDLRGTDLRGTDLRGANLYGASLRGAHDVKIATLVDTGHTFFSLGPIGSRDDILMAFNTDKGVFVTTGCFQAAPVDDFLKAVAGTHGENEHARAYRGAIVLIKGAFGVL